jgi:hypothetical protein
MALTLVAGGCLIEETDTNLYLDPDGGLTITHLQQNVRSDEKSPEARALEEEAFLGRVQAGGHDVALALYTLGPEWLDTRVLREERPYTVETTARFDSIERVYRTFLDRLGLPGGVELSRDGDVTRLVVELRGLDALLEEESDEWPREVDTLATLLLTEDRIELTDGVFVEAEGFEIDGPRAVPVEIDEEVITGHGASLRIVLGWTTSQP